MNNEPKRTMAPLATEQQAAEIYRAAAAVMPPQHLQLEALAAMGRVVEKTGELSDLLHRLMDNQYMGYRDIVEESDVTCTISNLETALDALPVALGPLKALLRMPTENRVTAAAAVQTMLLNNLAQATSRRLDSRLHPNVTAAAQDGPTYTKQEFLEMVAAMAENQASARVARKDGAGNG